VLLIRSLGVLVIMVTGILGLAACSSGPAGSATPFSLGGGSQIQGFTPTPTAQVMQVDPREQSEESAESEHSDVSRNPGLDVFLAKGCTACHTIQGVPAAVGVVGPNLTNVASNAGGRTGLAAKGYILQSILDPGAFIVDGFAPAMPAGLVTEGAELDALVQYLLTLG